MCACASKARQVPSDDTAAAVFCMWPTKNTCRVSIFSKVLSVATFQPRPCAQVAGTRHTPPQCAPGSYGSSRRSSTLARRPPRPLLPVASPWPIRRSPPPRPRSLSRSTQGCPACAASAEESQRCCKVGCEPDARTSERQTHDGLSAAPAEVNSSPELPYATNGFDVTAAAAVSSGAMRCGGVQFTPTARICEQPSAVKSLSDNPYLNALKDTYDYLCY